MYRFQLACPHCNHAERRKGLPHEHDGVPCISHALPGERRLPLLPLLTQNNMNLLFKNVHKSPSLIAFSDYRESEARNDLQTSVSNSGELLEYETLELRVNPPNIDIDNNYDPSCTLITVDSANRPGTLVEVPRPGIAVVGKLVCQDLRA